MRLLLSGGWFGSGGLYELPIKKVRFSDEFSQLKDFSGFVLLSYSLASEMLELPIKDPHLPKLILVELEGFSPRRVELNPHAEKPHLYLTGMEISPREYMNKVLKVKEHIERGDIYQLNLTNRFSFKTGARPLDIFYKFFNTQPVPYAFLLELDEFYILSGSMELFLEKRGKLLSSKPIKGTSKTLSALENSEKDRAENLMITDMVRNDIGRIADVGSVRVEELFKIEEYETLYQMHSTVLGTTKAGIPEILEATFPPASVTGAPKRKAVEIIDKLEPHSREYYCGSAGLIYPQGDFTLSVLIRTAIGVGNELNYYAGCGIVWDSEPEKELQEMFLKVRAFHPIEGSE